MSFHLYQFGPPVISYVADRGRPKGSVSSKEIPSVRPQDADGWNDGGGQSGCGDGQMARSWRSVDEVGANIRPKSFKARTTLWGMALSAGRVPNRDKLLPSPQVLKQQQMKMMMEAQKQLAVQSAVEGAVQEKERVAQRFKDVREGLSRRALAEKMVNMAGGQQGEDGNAPTDQ